MSIFVTMIHEEPEGCNKSSMILFLNKYFSDYQNEEEERAGIVASVEKTKMY